MKDILIKIPWSEKFPATHPLFSLHDFPDSVSDGLVVDFYCPEIASSLVNHKKTLKESLELVNRQMLLSKPVYVGRQGEYDFYVCVSANGSLITMQTKYYQYFILKYPKCRFACADSNEIIAVIEQDDKIVGLFMPLILDSKIYDEIKGGFNGT